MPSDQPHSDALEQALEACREMDAGMVASQQVEAYRQLLLRSWQSMTQVMGIPGARAVAEHALRQATRQRPDAGMVAIGADGFDLSELERNPPDPQVHCNILRRLTLAVFQILTELTGDVLVDPLLREMDIRGRDENRP